MARDHLLCTKTDEANAEVAKTCILSFNQQGPQTTVADRLKISECQYGKEHKIHPLTNWFIIFGE